MRDTELYRQLLALGPDWTVSRVEVDAAQARVDVWAEHVRDAKWTCPDCGAAVSIYDHADERAWRHLDTMQYATYLHARPPRVRCDVHGVRQAKLPWAEPRSRFSLLFERLAIDVLQEMTVSGAMRVLRISWDEAWHIMQRAVARGQRAKDPRSVPRRIGIDEKAATKGHHYLTLVCDLDRSTVEYIGEGRRVESIEGFFKPLSVDQRLSIEVIAMDMWDAFYNTALRYLHFHSSRIVFDRFHVMRHMMNALDDVRKSERRELGQGDDRLKGTMHLWRYSPQNFPERHKDRFELLKASDLKTARAWAIKENLRALWECPDLETARSHWQRWNDWALRSQLKPVVAAAKTIARHIDNILSFFHHRVTNAISEGINSKIQTIKKMAYGFRNKANFRTAIFFRCGGLQLYPAH